MKAKAVIAVTICLLIVAGIVAYANIDYSGDPMYEFGSIEAQHDGEAVYYLTLDKNSIKDLSDMDIAISAKHFAIPEATIEKCTKEIEHNGTTNAREAIINSLSERYSVYCKALLEGYTVTDEEIKAEIEKNIMVFAETESDDYAAFLAGIDMTNEQYWNSEYDNLKVWLITDKYYNACKKDFLSLDETDGMVQAYELQSWDSYWEELKAQIVADENIQIIK